MNKIRKSIICLSIVISFTLAISASDVFAAAWWGEGYRDPAWVVAHGGTIFNYSVVGAKSTKKYKAMMFQGGKYVEVEFGGKGVFDDAKNGTYTISFYKCKKSCLDHKTDKKTKIRGNDKLITTITVVARPGQTNNIIFDVATGRAFLAGRSGGVAAPVDPFIAAKKAAKEKEGSAIQFARTKEIDHRFKQVSHLSSNIKFAQFEKMNKHVGIVPQYDKMLSN